MKEKIAAITSLILISIQWSYLNGQNISSKINTYNWPSDPITKIAVDPKFADEDAVVLDENVDFKMLIKQTNVYNNNYLKKHVRIKFLTQKGVDRYSKFVLPESFDPALDNHDLEIWKRDSVHRPKANYSALNYFSARIIKPDGSIVPAQIEGSSSFEDFFIYMIDYKFYDFSFQIKNLNVNDELEVAYSVSDFFGSPRVFFNGELSKQNCSFSFTYDLTRTYIVQGVNNGNPQDTSESKDGKYKTFFWNFKNLAGCINQTGSHYYKELPYFVYYLNPHLYGNMDRGNVAVETVLPFTWGFAFLDYVKYDLKHDTLKDNDNAAVRTFFHNQTDAVKDTNPAIRFNKIHQLIVDSFWYQKDTRFYEGTDFRLPRIAEFLQNRTLRQISRDTVYNKLLYLFNRPYYFLMPFDNRFQQMDYNLYEPFDDSHGYFCLLKENIPHYFYPKDHRFGLYEDEFPFYLENVNTMLIPQREAEDEYYKLDKRIRYIQIKTPQSVVNNNSRTTTVMAAVNTDSGSIRFAAKLKLAGQFSTMQRGYYDFGYYDSTVSMQYFKGVNDDINGAMLLGKEKTDIQRFYPFTTQYNINYQSNALVKKQKDNSFSIDMSAWFKHIIYDDVKGNKRELDFYPDFVFLDSYKYYLKFSKPATIVNADDFNTTIENALGILNIAIQQVQPDVVLISSDFVVNKEVVSAKNCGDVETIYSALRKIIASQIDC